MDPQNKVHTANCHGKSFQNLEFYIKVTIETAVAYQGAIPEPVNEHLIFNSEDEFNSLHGSCMQCSYVI